ncbi:TonB-dependent receptor [Niveispirillum sp. KHB5.9]|uniref:TonB-dependent receptor n=1 Tax=Niveispirillum sp. KHB5.9 TaxID=3400269 RepID=UPI003A875159
MKARTLKTLTSILAISCVGTAYAQAPSAPPPAPAADAAQDIPLDFIVVTAQRRTQRLVDVPISVATATPEDLERAGATSIENLTKVTPGIYLQRAVYGLSPTIRGIGSTLTTSGGEQNVALYVDEIYYSTPTGNIFDLASVAGVEVLKGPQGTLFGRNATGGAILVRTLDPGFTPAGRFNVSYERFDQVRTSGYLNVPLGEKVAINGSVAYRHSNGYVRDLKTDKITNEGESFTARGKLLLEPTDNFQVVFTAAHADFDDPSGSDTKNIRPARLVAAVGGPIATDRYHSSNNTEQTIETRTDEYSARARLDLEAGTVSSFTALLRNKLDALNEIDLSYANQNVGLQVNTKVFSQEVNFASRDDRPFTYVTGLYYFRSRGKVPFVTSTGAPLSNSAGRLEAAAGYADGTYRFGDLSLIAGIRYSDEKRQTWSAAGVLAPSPYTRIQKANDKQWTPRVGLSYALDEETRIYTTYSKGFKSGVFDATSPTGPGVTPEKVDAFEAGFKTAAHDITFNAAAFYYDYKDTQVNATISGQNGQVFTQLFNVPKSRIYGVEADASLRLSEAFDLRAAVAYTHARYVDFKSAPGYVDAPTNPATLGGLLYANVSLDVSGKAMVRSPEFTASSTLAYYASLDDNKELEVTLSPYYSSRVHFTFDNSLSQSGYVLFDAAATVTINDNIKVSVFGRNLTDRKYKVSMSQNALSLEGWRYAQPRIYGLSLGYSF